MWIESPLWQESEFKTQRQQLCKGRKIWEMLKRRDGQPESLKKHSRSWCILSETVWVILEVARMKWMGKTRLMIKMIQSCTTWAKMTNPAGWWEQSPRWYTKQWRDCGRRRLGLMKWCNRDGETWPTTSIRDICSTGLPDSGFRPLSTPKQTWLQPHLHRQYLKILCSLLISSW